jgi:hypothetical protein
LQLELANAQRLDDPLAWFGYMLQEEVPPNEQTMDIIVSVYCKFNWYIRQSQKKNEEMINSFNRP